MNRPLEQVWEHYVGDQPPSEFLRILDAEIAEGKYPDRKAAFLNYADFALTNLCIEEHKQIPFDDGYNVETLAAALQQYAER